VSGDFPYYGRGVPISRILSLPEFPVPAGAVISLDPTLLSDSLRPLPDRYRDTDLAPGRVFHRLRLPGAAVGSYFTRRSATGYPARRRAHLFSPLPISPARSAAAKSSTLSEVEGFPSGGPSSLRFSGRSILHVALLASKIGGMVSVALSLPRCKTPGRWALPTPHTRCSAAGNPKPKSLNPKTAAF